MNASRGLLVHSPAGAGPLAAPAKSALASGEARELCYRTLARGSKSFSFASRLLPPEARYDTAVLYTFCRRVDDAIDGAPKEGAPEALATLGRRLRSVYDGEAQPDVGWQAFAALVRAIELPERYPEDLLAGMLMDVDGTRYRTIEDLLLYCHRVAGVVGLMMCHVLRIESDNALRHAAHLGIALQLTNICRDVAEDWQLGRLYLPDTVLHRAGATELHDQLGGPVPSAARAPLARAVEQLLNIAESFYRSADRGLSSLPWRAAFAVRTARLVYSRIGGRLRARGCDVFSGRVVVPGYEKLALLARSAAFSAWELTTRSPAAEHALPRRTLYFPEHVLPVSLAAKAAGARSR